jgi:hypothetical protein
MKVQIPGGRSGEISTVYLARRDMARAWAGLTTPKGTEKHRDALQSGTNIALSAFSRDYKDSQFQINETMKRILE